MKTQDWGYTSNGWDAVEVATNHLDGEPVEINAHLQARALGNELHLSAEPSADSAEHRERLRDDYRWNTIAGLAQR